MVGYESSWEGMRRRRCSVMMIIEAMCTRCTIVVHFIQYYRIPSLQISHNSFLTPRVIINNSINQSTSACLSSFDVLLWFYLAFRIQYYLIPSVQISHNSFSIKYEYTNVETISQKVRVYHLLMYYFGYLLKFAFVS